MSVGLGTAVGYLTLDTAGFARGIDTAITDMERLNGSSRTVASSLQTVGSTITSTGAVLTAGLTAPVVGFGAASVKAGTEFDAAMAKVQAVSNATADELALIRDRALEMGEKTRYSASEVADAMYYMGLAGWDARQIYDGVPGVLALAAASGEDLSRVSDIVTDSLTAFGKSAEDTTEFVNILAETTRSSNTTVDLLGESFKYVAPVAGAFGYSMQDVAVMLGIFANNGVKGSQAGTGLRQALNSLINPSDKAAAQMDKYGVSLFNADGSTKDLMTVMSELRGTFGGLAVDIHNADGEVMTGEEIMEKYGHSLPTSEMEKLTAIVQIFGVRALPGMLSVINATEADFGSLTDAVYGAQDAYDGLGTAFGMQQTMLDNLQGDWYLFTSALGTTKIILSDMAKGALRDLLQSLTELINKFNQMTPEQQEQIVKWAMMVAAIGPALVALGKVISGIGSLINTFKLLSGAFSTIGSAIGSVIGDVGAFMSLVGEEGLMATITGLTGLSGGAIAAIAAIAAAVVALIAAFVTLWKTNEEFRDKMIGIWEGIKEKFIGAFQKITDAINSLGFDFENIVEVLKAAWMGFCDLVAPLFEGAFAIIGEVLGWAINIIADFVQVITGIIKGFKDGDWSLLWEGLCNIITDTIDAILGILDALGETLWNLIQTIANWFGADWTMTWDEAKQAVADWFDSVIEWFKELPGKIGEFFSNIGQAISDFFSSVWEFISSIPGKIAGFFSDIWNSVTTWVSDMVSKAVELGTNFVTNIVTWFQELPGRIWEFITSALENVVTWAGNMVAKAREMASNFLNNIIEFFSDLPYKIGYYIGYALGTVIKWVSDMVTKAREMASTFLNNIVEFFTQLPGKILEFITSAWNNIVQWATNMVNKAREMATSFLNNIIAFFQQLPGKILEFITSAWNNVVQWATNMVNKAKEMAMNFLNNIVSFFQQLPGKILEFITSAWNNVVTWATNMINKAKEMAQNFLNNIVSFFQQLPGKIKEFITSAWNNVVSWATNMINKAKEMAQNFLNNVVNTLRDLPGKVKEKLTEALNKVIDWVKDMGAKGLEAAKELINKFKEGAANVAETVKSIGQNIVDGVWNGIKAAKDAFVNNVKSFFSGIVDGVKDALGINSPSTVFADEVGYWLPMGAGEGFVEAVPAAMRMMQTAFNRGVDRLSLDGIDMNDELMRFVAVFKYVFESLVIWYESMEERLYQTIENMRDYFEYMLLVGQAIENANQLGSGVVIVDNKPRRPVPGDDGTSGDGSGDGDTFIFYSNEPINEIKAARLLRDTKRDMAEGFA